MPHELVRAAARVYSGDDVLKSVAGIAAALDARLADCAALDLTGVRRLAADVSLAHANTGGTAHGWYRAAMAMLAQDERDRLGESRELPMILLDTNTTVFSAGGAGSRASERAVFGRR